MKAKTTIVVGRSGEQNKKSKPSRPGRKPRNLNHIKVVKRVWWRTGNGTYLASEEIEEELRDSRGRKAGFMGHPVKVPKCRRGGGNFFRAVDHAHSLVDRALAKDGGAK